MFSIAYTIICGVLLGQNCAYAVMLVKFISHLKLLAEIIWSKNIWINNIVVNIIVPKSI